MMRAKHRLVGAETLLTLVLLSACGPADGAQGVDPSSVETVTQSCDLPPEAPLPFPTPGMSASNAYPWLVLQFDDVATFDAFQAELIAQGELLTRIDGLVTISGTADKRFHIAQLKRPPTDAGVCRLLLELSSILDAAPPTKVFRTSPDVSAF